MWQLSVPFALMLMSLCPSESQNVQGCCGQLGPHAVDENGKINFNEIVAKPAELPWTVKIFRYSRDYGTDNAEYKNVHRCNGALIHPKIVLASLHCVYQINTRELTIRAGEWDTSSSDGEINPVEERNISGVIIHENADPWGLKNMVAMIILSSPLELTKNVDVICVPRKSDDYDESNCIVSGWGTRASDPDQTKLKRYNLPIIPQDACRNSYDEYSAAKGWRIPLSPTAICAGSKEHPDMCEGDTGSLLICPMVSDQSRYVLVGIEFTGLGCITSPYLPSQFADVPAARDWIDAKMSALKLDLSGYTVSSN